MDLEAFAKHHIAQKADVTIATIPVDDKDASGFGIMKVNEGGYIEKFIEEPRHIEIQIIGDKHGKTLYLPERECSIQRRNQKVVEEAPSTFLDQKTRVAMGEQAVMLAKAVGYHSAGTVEFLVDAQRNFYCLEMNTRLQVEHPVTEMILGMDLVEWQLKVAAGEVIDFAQDDVQAKGHAIELRLCAEDPDKRFMPSPGTLSTVQWPEGDGIRVDAGVESGSEITPYYDSMFAKLIAHADTRDAVITKLQGAVENTRLEGIATNLSLHKRVLVDETFKGGTYTTAFVADVLGLKA